VTFEKKCFIAPREIRAVRFTCSNCRTDVTVPIEKVRDGDVGLYIARRCQCGMESSFDAATTATENLIRFNKLLATLSSTLKGQNIEYSLQVDCPE
jgi:hypothetical protein